MLPLLVLSPAETIPLKSWKGGDGCEHSEVFLSLEAAPAFKVRE